MGFIPKAPFLNARKTYFNGIPFHSKGEAARYEYLVGELESGNIEGLYIQHAFPISYTDECLVEPREHFYRPTKYIVDFVIKTEEGYVFEDYKRGHVSRACRDKINHVMGKYGIKINIYQDSDEQDYYLAAKSYRADPSLEGRALEFMRRDRVEKYMQGNRLVELTEYELSLIGDPWANFPPLNKAERSRLLKFMNTNKKKVDGSDPSCDSV